MNTLFQSNISQWLQVQPANQDDLYELTFAEHHLGNIWIRSLHGGVSGAAIELVAEAHTRKQLGDETISLTTSSTAIDYLRVTRDVNLFARAKTARLSRRLSIVDVVCWQDDENAPVVRGTITLKIER